MRGLSVFLMNFAVFWGLLGATDGLTGGAAGPWRICAGAALGAVYGWASGLAGFGFLEGNLWRGVLLGLTALVSFGPEPGSLRRTGVLLLLSLALGGAEECLRLRSWSLGAGALALALGCRLLLRGSLGRAGQLVPVCIRLGSRQVELTALRDSGNSLWDPFSGQPVLLAQGDAARTLLGRVDLRDPGTALETLRRTRPELRCRLIPYSAVGGGGLLLAVRCDRVTAGGKEQGRLVAFCPGKLSGTGEYQALTEGEFYG